MFFSAACLSTEAAGWRLLSPSRKPLSLYLGPYLRGQSPRVELLFYFRRISVDVKTSNNKVIFCTDAHVLIGWYGYRQRMKYGSDGLS